MQPDSPDYAFNLAVGLEHIGQQKTALTYYRKALDLSFKKGRANFDQNLAIERVGQLSAQPGVDLAMASVSEQQRKKPRIGELLVHQG